MSWTLDGVVYHSRADYERARQLRDERQARAMVEELREEERALRREHVELERAFEHARDDLERQMRVNQQIESNVKNLERLHRQQAQAFETLAVRSQAEFERVRTELRSGLDCLGQRIEVSEEELRRLDEQQQAHAERVRQQFAQLRAEVAASLEQAERRRAETEQRLAAEVRRVDEKVEADRQARLNRHHDVLARAHEQVVMVEESLRRTEGTLAALGLEEEAQSIRDQVAQARAAWSAGDATASLAIGAAASGQVRTLEYRRARREAELADERRQVKERGTSVLRRLEASPGVREAFPREVAVAQDLVASIAVEAEAAYRDHRRLPLEADRHGRMLERIEQQALTMTSAAPIVNELIEQRKVAGIEVIRKLMDVYGPLDAERTTQRLADPADPKSPLVVCCNFGGAQVDVGLDLDGAYTVDAYAHGTNAECEQRATATLGALAGATVVQGTTVDTRNRVQPSVPVERPTPAWHAVEAELRRIRMVP